MEDKAPKTKTKVSMVKKDIPVTVELLGSDNELQGSHIIFYGDHQHIEFIDGIALVMESVALNLRSQGMVK